MDTVITVRRLAREFRPMRVHMSCTTTLHVAVKTEHVCRSRHNYMHFTSQRFAVGIHIPRRRVVLEVCFSRPCGKAFSLIIHKHSVLSVLLVPFYKTFDLFCGSFNILLQFLYCYVKAFTSTLYFFSSFFLIPSFKGLLLH